MSIPRLCDAWLQRFRKPCTKSPVREEAHFGHWQGWSQTSTLTVSLGQSSLPSLDLHCFLYKVDGRTCLPWWLARSSSLRKPQNSPPCLQASPSPLGKLIASVAEHKLRGHPKRRNFNGLETGLDPDLVQPCRGHASHLAVSGVHYVSSTLNSIPRTVVEIYLAGGHHAEPQLWITDPGSAVLLTCISNGTCR